MEWQCRACEVNTYNAYHATNCWRCGGPQTLPDGSTYQANVGCCCEKPTVEIKWEIPERFRGMKMVEWAISNFGDLYARFEDA